jgi:calcium permeable stress-gated cation channel
LSLAVVSHSPFSSLSTVRSFDVALTIATGGGGQTGLDILSFSNIAGNKNRYFAHVFIGWIYIAFILWYLTKELLLFKKTRQEYLRRPEIASNIAQRSILITAVPQELLTEEKLTAMFERVEKVWINRNHDDLQDLVDERNKDALLLEGGETSLIKDVNKIATKKGKKDPPENYDKNITSLYIKDKKRPHHKLGKPVIKLLFGKKVHCSIIKLIVGGYDQLDTN